MSLKSCLPCKLDAITQYFVKLIFDNDMFKDALLEMDIGTFSHEEIGGGHSLKSGFPIYCSTVEDQEVVTTVTTQ